LRTVQQQQGSASHSFLLDDDSSNPFNANDVESVMDDKALYTALATPEPLRANPAFDFLRSDLKLAAPTAPPAQ
jgi:myosin V